MTDSLSKAGSLIGDFDFGAWGGKMEGMVHTATKLASYMAPTDSYTNEVSYRPAAQRWAVRTP